MALIKWDDVVNRYPKVADLGGDVEVEGAWIMPAIAEVEGALAVAFTTPFSDNNMTAIDLCIDMTYCRMQESKMSSIAEALRKRLNDRIALLVAGKTTMVTSGGAALAGGGGLPWSNTMGYNPVFGMGDVENSIVDSSQVYGEEQAKL